jgi:hypothetical protein
MKSIARITVAVGVIVFINQFFFLSFFSSGLFLLPVENGYF